MSARNINQVPGGGPRTAEEIRREYAEIIQGDWYSLQPMPAYVARLPHSIRCEIADAGRTNSSELSRMSFLSLISRRGDRRAAEIAALYALNDPDQHVRACAIDTLMYVGQKRIAKSMSLQLPQSVNAEFLSQVCLRIYLGGYEWIEVLKGAVSVTEQPYFTSILNLLDELEKRAISFQSCNDLLLVAETCLARSVSNRERTEISEMIESYRLKSTSGKNDSDEN